MRLQWILLAVLVLALPHAARASVHARPYTPLYAALRAVASRQGVPLDTVLADAERWLTEGRAPERRVADAESGVLGSLGWDEPVLRFALPLQLGWGYLRIAAGDFDGDGVADLAAAKGLGAVTIFAGSATAPLQARRELTLAGGDLLECAVDVDGDGRCDLVASGYYDSMVVVYRSLGGGDFAAAQRYRVPVQFPYVGWYDDRPDASVTPADLTGDGRPDFVVTGVWDSLIVTLVNTGAGEFVVGPGTNVGGWVKALTVADFDGDGWQDCALVGSGEWPGATIRVLPSRGDGSFGPPSVVAQPGWGSGGALGAGDFDADGRADLVAYGDDGYVRVLSGSGGGGFSERCVVPLGGYGHTGRVRSADLDGDGQLDVVVGHRGEDYTPQFAVMSGSPTGMLAAPQRYLAHDRAIYDNPFCYSLVCADFDADGDPDLADITSNYLGVVLNDGGDALQAPGTLGLAFAPWGIATARLGPGARPDLLLWDGTSTWFSRSRGAYGFGEAVRYAAGEVVATRDLDANGTEDLVLANGDTTTVILNDGAGGLVVAGTYYGGTFLTCADFGAVNGPDLAVADSNSHVIFRLNDGHGSFGPPVDSGVLLAADATAVLGGDVDQDGRADLLVGRKSGGGDVPDTLEVHWNDGDAFAAAQSISIVSYGYWPHPARIALGDFDGDGRTDVLVVEGAMGDYGSGFSIAHGAGGRAFAAVEDHYAGLDPWDAVVADFDRDGLDDVAVVCDNDNTVTGFVGVFRGAPGGVTDLGRIYCQHYSTGIATADLDLDGRLDLAVTNVSARAVTLHRNVSPAGDPTPALLSLVSANVTEAGVELVWFTGGGSSAVATVYRSPGSDGWTRLGQVTPDGTGHLRYVDPAPAPAGRVGYRLGIVEAGVEAFYGETWVDLPARLVAMGLEGVRPNPWRGGPLEVRFTLPTDQPATLDLLDVAGRRIVRRSLVGHGAGPQAIGLDEGARLAPGLYLVRVTQGTESRTMRVAVLR